MSFPESVANEALVRSERCCCICHKFCGTKIELHHIIQKAYGGDDTIENCIPLCFDCHSDMGKGDPNHPKGKRYSEKELRLHRDNWYKKVESGLLSSGTKAVYDEDKALFKKICALFTEDVRYWLIETDIGSYHPYDVFHDLECLLHGSKDPFYEFINPELEKLKGELFTSLDCFLAYKATNTFRENIGGQKMCATKLWLLNHTNWYPHGMTDDEIIDMCHQEVSELHTSAKALWNTYCDFVRQCRRMLSY